MLKARCQVIDIKNRERTVKTRLKLLSKIDMYTYRRSFSARLKWVPMMMMILHLYITLTQIFWHFFVREFKILTCLFLHLNLIQSRSSLQFAPNTVHHVL